MTRGVRREGGRALKDVAGRPVRAVESLVRRTERLRALGLRTPGACYDRPRQRLVFEWCDGTTGRAALREHVARVRGDWGRVPGRTLASVLAPLVRLHALPTEDLALERLDPWRRIDRRLAALTCRRSALVLPLRRTLGVLLEAAPEPGGRPVHGDFHAGQVVLPDTHAAAGAEPWLLDLDDLGLGSAESDLGNFVAHVVTSDDLFVGDPRDGAFRVGARVRSTYEGLAGRPCAPGPMRVHTAVALVRRALKLGERGLSDAGFARLIEAAATLGDGTTHAAAG